MSREENAKKVLELMPQLVELVTEGMADDRARSEMRELDRLRDSFARAAVQGIVLRRASEASANEIAKTAYEIADAMMRERAKTKLDDKPAPVPS